MKNYRELHGKKKRGKQSAKEKRELSEKELLSKARKVFERFKRRRKTREMVALMPNLAIRIDLTGSPEVSFTISIKKGKAGFSKKKTAARIALGIQKERFLKLIKKPPRGNLKKTLFDKIFLRKGPVREFQWLKSLLVPILTG